MKCYFKGDPEFSYDGFHRLPYEYAYFCYSKALEFRQKELHLAERPLSLIMAQNANLNRDVKKRKTPFDMEDFYLYQPEADKNLPAGRYGAAALWLAENKMFPSFALFCFPELRKNAGKNIPTVISFNHPSAILLAPTETEDGFKGLLIVEKAVSNQVIEMESPCGLKARLRIPTVSQEVAAQEDITLASY